LKIEKKFEIRADAAAVWEFLTDPYKVAECLPGAKITEKVEGTYKGTIAMKVGPVTSSYKGKMKFVVLDPASREAVITARGEDTRGKGSADLIMKSRVVPREDGVTEVVVESEAKVTGLLAQLGRGMIVQVSDQLFGKFAEAMRERLERSTDAASEPPPATTEPEPIDALALGARGLVRQPWFWVLAVVLAAVIVWALG